MTTAAGTPDGVEFVDTDHDNNNGTEIHGDRLDFIRQKRSALAGRRSLTLLVPGYGGVLAVRYKALDRSEIDQWLKKLDRTDATIDDNIDLLIRCCDSVLVRQNKESKWEPFDLDRSEPTTFSSGNLAANLGEVANSAREEVKVLFSPDGSQPLAPESHSTEVLAWQRDVDYEADRALLGE